MQQVLPKGYCHLFNSIFFHLFYLIFNRVKGLQNAAAINIGRHPADILDLLQSSLLRGHLLDSITAAGWIIALACVSDLF